MKDYIKAAAYCRFSSDNQRSESIDAQVRAIKEYCKKNRYKLVSIYKDEALSGTSDKRDQFQQMITDSNKKEFDIVIVHKLDRFARNRYDSAIYKKKLKDNGILVISVLENLDNSPESVILESVLEGMNEYYSKNLSREVRKGQYESALKCTHLGGIAPLGYDVNNDKTYSINEREAEAVRLIFDLYTKGYGYKLIADDLNDKGFKTKLGRMFSKTSIRDVINNEKYRGVYVWNKRLSKKAGNNKYKSDEEIVKIEGGMPAIIDSTTWYAAHKKLVDGKQTSKRVKSTHPYILAGKIFCKCGARFVGNTSGKNASRKNGKRYYSYICTSKRSGKGCKSISISANKIENYIINLIKENIFNDNVLASLTQMIADYINKTNNSSSSIKEEMKELKDTELKVAKVLDLYLDGIINKDTLDSKTKDLNARIGYLKEKIATAQQLDHDYNLDDINSYLQSLKKEACASDSDNDINQKLINMFLYKAYVDDINVEIRLAYDTLIFNLHDAQMVGGAGRNNTLYASTEPQFYIDAAIAHNSLRLYQIV